MNVYLPALCRRLLAIAAVIAMGNTLMVAPVYAQTLVVQEFCNTQRIDVPDYAPASLYPSPISVTGLGQVVSVTATLKGLAHQDAYDFDVLLSAPSPDKNIVLMSDLGSLNVSGVNVTFDDAAADPAPTPLVSGTYRPLNRQGTSDPFAAPAPARSGATTMSTFAGTLANGTWNLWVMDDGRAGTGSIHGGWCLKLTTLPPIDGACGSAHATTPLLTTSPSTNLCTVGSASPVGSDVDAYRWSCAGVYGGIPASCKAPRGYTVTPSAGANGSISPNTPQVVAFHGTQSFTVTPNAGYSASATGCSGTLIGSTFTTSAVTDDCSVAASFTGNDSVPGAFGFVTQVGVGLSTLITSNTITLTGLTAAANISITNGEYQINGGSFVSTPGTVSNGNTIAVRHTSSANFLTQVTTTVTVGTVQGTFNSTTLAPPAVNGVCGSSHNTGSTPLLTTPPVSDLCSVGNSIRMHIGLADYRWSCTGTNGGSPASCGAPRGYTVTASAGSNGSISPSGAQVVAYHAAPAFTITPTTGFTASASGCDGTLTGTTYIAGAVTANCALSASFALNSYAISATAQPSNAGVVTCTATSVQHGGTTSCTATAYTGYRFDGFSDDCTGNTCFLSNVTAAKVVTANFTPAVYALSTVASPVDGGTVSCVPTSVSHGSNATCTATPNAGFAFSRFTGDCTGSICSLNNVTADRSVTANFVRTYTVGGQVSGILGSGLVLQLNLDPTTNITINSNGTFAFPTRLNDGSNFKVTVISQPPGQVCSIFAAKGTLNGANNTGVTVTCASGAVTTVGGTTPGTTGTTTASITGGGASCGFLHASFVSAASVAPTPPDVQFPLGMLDFDTAGCTNGSTVKVTVTYPQNLNPASQYWKYGRRPGNPTPSWYVLPATITGNKVVFSITDGGLGDDDTTVNGVIADPGGPGFAVAAGGVEGVPTLSEWAMALLAGLMALATFAALRRREV